MKKTLCFAILLASTNVTFADNVEVKKSGLSESLMHNIIERDVDKAIQAAKLLSDTLKKSRTDDEASIDKAFSHFVVEWKAVETVYVAGELDEDAIDIPRLIDTYHNGKENLTEQLKRIIKKNEPAKNALFKNTFKSISALSFFLYADNKLSDSERNYSIYAIEAITKHLVNIKESYSNHSDDFLADEAMSMAYVLNALIDSSYKLKEWRVGDPAGLSRKYKNKPNNLNQEYPYSNKSMAAIDAILTTHADIMGIRDYMNFGSSAIEQGATDEVTLIRKLITDAKNQVRKLKEKETIDFLAPEIKVLYKTLGDLNDAYYISLISALPIQAKILDADGD